MAALHETAYPRLKPNPDAQELEQNFLPKKEEMDLLAKNTSKQSPHSQLGFMLSLKCFQCLGYHTPINAIPKTVVDYIANYIDVEVDKVKLQSYMQLKQRKRHKILICKFLMINNCKQQRKSIMKSSALKSAATKENLADIINDILEELIKSNFEIPAFSTLLRLARASRTIVSTDLYQKISDQLTVETKKFFDQLLSSDEKFEEHRSGWEYLKQDLKKPTTNNVKAFTDYLEQLRIWRNQSPIDLSEIPEHRLDQYVAEAIALDISDMRRIKEAKRYALSAMLLYQQYAKSLDSIVAVLARWLRNIKNDATDALSKIREATQSTTDQLISDFKKVLTASKQTSETAQEKLELIEQSLPYDVDAAIKACDQHLLYADDNILPLMLEYYLRKRQTMFRLIKQIEIKSSSQDNLIEKLIEFMLLHQRSHADELELNVNEFNNLEWLDDQWFQFVTNLKSRRSLNQIQTINKQRFELSVFRFIIDEINCADAYVLNSYEHDDPNKQFISWEDFYQNLTSYTELIGKPENPQLFIDHLQIEHHEAAEKANKNFVENEYFIIVDSEPVLKRVVSQQVSQEHQDFSNIVASKMPLTDIISVFLDVENWLNLSHKLKPLSGYESKIKDYELRFIATWFAYGCNAGPVQAERCLKKYSRKQIAWLFNHHITEVRLNNISEAIIEAYKQFDLPYIWGNGESASVDGTYWDMYTNNLLAEHHIRYGKYGGIGYYYVSDQYVALFGNFIPCGVYEAIYNFDGIYEIDESIRPEIIHGDTHAQSEVVFGFAYLLAITIMPRIRSFKHLNFYRPTSVNEKSYQHIRDIFTSKEPEWQLIGSMYYDMLRVVMSIQNGNIKASTILKKLCYKSKKNKLHQAFRELGRVVRTIFLLDYISDADLRRKIQAATCKSEEFNDFIDWIAFGKNGIIEENNPNIQKKITSFSRMTANAVIFHTVANQTNILNQLVNEGIEYDNDSLSILSAFFRGNINRYGVFELSKSKTSMPLEFNIQSKKQT